MQTFYICTYYAGRPVDTACCHFQCAAAGNLKRFQELHAEDPSCIVFRDDQRGRSSAHYAAAGDKVEIIKYIVLTGGGKKRYQ